MGKLEYIPETLGRDKEIRKAFEIANQATLSPEGLKKQHKRKDFIYIQKAAISYVEKKAIEAEKKVLQQGIEQRIEQGKKMGIEEGLQISILGLYKHGIAKEEISRIIGVEPDFVTRVIDR